MKKVELKRIRLIVGCICLIVGISSFAEKKEDESRLPLGCHDTGYKNKLRILSLLPGESGERNSMYFLYNKLGETIKLYNIHYGDNNFSIYLNHFVSPKKWAVFSTNERKVDFICTVPDKKLSYGKIIDCANALIVCEYTKVKFGLNNRGNLWIVNSNTKNGAIREVVRYGIIPAY